MRYRAAIVLPFLPFLAACDSSDGDSGPPLSDDAPIDIERVFDELTFTRPLAMLQAPGDNGR
jgi:hypothetical protein